MAAEETCSHKNKKPRTMQETEDEVESTLLDVIQDSKIAEMDVPKQVFSELVHLFKLEGFESLPLDVEFQEIHKANVHYATASSEFKKIHVAGILVSMGLYANSKENGKKKVIDLLIQSNRDVILNLSSYNYLNDLLHTMDYTEFDKLVFPLIKSILSKPWDEQTLDGLFLLLIVQRRFPESIPTEFLENNLGTSDVLCSESLDYICKILVKIPEKIDYKHAVFEILIAKLSESDLVEMFFTKLDAAMTFSRNEYFTFTTLLTGVLQNIKNPQVIPNILTENFLDQTISWYSKMKETKDLDLKDLTQNLFNTLIAGLKKDRENTKIVIKVLRKLITFQGVYFYFQIVKSDPVIQNIVNILTVKGVKESSEIFKNTILESHDDTEKVSVVRLLSELIHHSEMGGEIEWKTEQMIFLGKLCIVKKLSENVREEVLDFFHEVFYKSFDMKLTKLHDLRNMISRIFNEFVAIVNGNNWDVLRKPLKRKYHRIWKQTVEIVAQLNGSSLDKDIIFHILFSWFGIQLFTCPVATQESLSEVFICYESSKDSTNSDDDRVWIAIVDLFLNLLSYGAWFVSDIITYVFPIVCKYLNSTILHQMWYVLDPTISSIPDPNQPGEEEQQEEEENEEETEEGGYESSGDEGDEWSFSEEESTGEEPADHSEGPADLSDSENSFVGDRRSSPSFFRILTCLAPTWHEQKAMRNYRVNVLKLIEVYLNHNPPMLQTLEILKQLMRLLQFCVKNQRPKELSEAIKRCLQQLPSLKFKESKEVTERFLVELLVELFNKDKLKPQVIEKMNDSIVDCATCVLNCSQHLETATEETSQSQQKSCLIENIKQAVTVFLIRDSTIPYDIIKEIFQSRWGSIQTFYLLPIAFMFVFMKYSRRRNVALELVKLFFANRHYIDSHREEMKAVEADIVKFLRDSIDFFRELNSKPTERVDKIIHGFLISDHDNFFRSAEIKKTIVASQKSAKEEFICNLLEILCDIRAGFEGIFQAWSDLESEVRECCPPLGFAQDTLERFRKFCGEGALASQPMETDG